MPEPKSKCLGKILRDDDVGDDAALFTRERQHAAQAGTSCLVPYASL